MNELQRHYATSWLLHGLPFSLMGRFDRTLLYRGHEWPSDLGVLGRGEWSPHAREMLGSGRSSVYSHTSQHNQDLLCWRLRLSQQVEYPTPPSSFWSMWGGDWRHRLSKPRRHTILLTGTQCVGPFSRDRELFHTSQLSRHLTFRWELTRY